MTKNDIQNDYIKSICCKLNSMSEDINNMLDELDTYLDMCSYNEVIFNESDVDIFQHVANQLIFDCSILVSHIRFESNYKYEHFDDEDEN